MEIVRDVRFGCDYIDEDNVLHVGGNGGLLIISGDQLELLPESYGQPGMMAHTAGWKAAWEMAADRTWANIKGGDDIGG